MRVKLNGCIFQLKIIIIWKNNTIWDSVILILKRNLIANLSSIKNEAKCFHDKEYPKVGSNHTCLAVISLDATLNKDENYNPQMFLKECKYIEK